MTDSDDNNNDDDYDDGNKKKNLGYISPECGSSLGRRRREAKKSCSDVLRSS